MCVYGGGCRKKSELFSRSLEGIALLSYQESDSKAAAVTSGEGGLNQAEEATLPSSFSQNFKKKGSR